MPNEPASSSCALRSRPTSRLSPPPAPRVCGAQWTLSMIRRGYDRADKKGSKKKGGSLAEELAKSRQKDGVQV